jgi:hypothetical protein
MQENNNYILDYFIDLFKESQTIEFQIEYKYFIIIFIFHILDFFIDQFKESQPIEFQIECKYFIIIFWIFSLISSKSLKQLNFR